MSILTVKLQNRLTYENSCKVTTLELACPSGPWFIPFLLIPHKALKHSLFRIFFFYCFVCLFFFSVCFLETKSLLWERWCLFHYTHREREPVPLLLSAERMAGDGCSRWAGFQFYPVDLPVEFALIEEAGSKEVSWIWCFLACAWVKNGWVGLQQWHVR